MAKLYRVYVRQPIFNYGFVDIVEGEDWDGRPVGDEFDARDLAYDLLMDGNDRAFWTDQDEENGDFQILEVKEINGDI